MSGRFFPGTLPWSFFDGAYTLSPDQETITGSGEIRSGWINAGTLARVRWDGPGSFTSVQMRSSAVLPPGRLDSVPIQLYTSERQRYYDQGASTLPSDAAFGFTRSGTFSNGSGNGVVGSDGIRLTASGAADYRRFPAGMTATTGQTIILRASFIVHASQAGISELYFGLSNRVQLTLYGTASNSGQLWYNGVGRVPGFTFAYDTKYDLLLVATATGANTMGQARLFIRPRGSQSATSLDGFTDYGLVPVVAVAQNILIMGSLGSNQDTTWGDLGVFVGQEWEDITNPDTSLTALARGWVQIKGTLSGNLTKLDLSNSTAAPADLTVSATPGSSGIITALASAPAAGNVLYWERTGPSTSAADYTNEQRAYAWSDCENGTHTLSVRQATTDGVLSVNAATSSATLPLVLPQSPNIGPAPAWVANQLRFYRPTAGTNPLSTLSVLAAATASGPYSLALSVAFSGVTWRPTDGTGQYVTAADLGLSVSSSAWYVDRITDSGNLSAQGSQAVYGGDPNGRLCLVTMDFGSSYAGRVVTATPSHAFTVRGETFTRTPYTVTLDGAGVGTLTLPRTAAGTPQDGTGTPFMVFQYANVVDYRVILDQSTADYPNLPPPGEFPPPDPEAGLLRLGQGLPGDDLGEIGDLYLDTLTGKVYQLREV